MNAAAEASLILILRTSLAAALSRRLGVSLCGPNSPQRRRGRELDQTRIRPRPDAFGQPALRRCNLTQLGCIFACRTAGLGLLTEPPAQFFARAILSRIEKASAAHQLHATLFAV